MLFAMLSVGFSLTLCDPVQGKLVHADGTAAADVTITREWHWAWSDNKGSDQTVTDVEGNFHFEGVEGKAIFVHILPHEPRIALSLAADVGGEQKVFFHASKSSYSAQEGLNMRYPINLICDIDADPYESSALYFGTCREAE